MRNWLFNKFSAIIIIICLFGAAHASDVSESLDMINYYFDLIRSGNIESATMFWDENDLSMSDRLGIKLAHGEIKVDCKSPILADKSDILQHAGYTLGSQVRLPDGAVRWKVRSNIIEPGSKNRFNYYYYAVKKDANYWLISPYSHYSAGWKVIDSKYFKFFMHPNADNKFNEFAASALDQYVDHLAQKLELGVERLKIIEQNKIYYYLCPNEIEVRKITGYLTEYYYDQSVDAVTSNGLSAYPAVAEQMLNMKLGSIDFQTAPFLKYGLATMLGGQTNRSPEVILDFGDYLMDYMIVELDSVILFDRLKDSTGMWEINSPILACFSEYLFDNYGIDKTLELYRILSGDITFIESLTIESIKKMLSESVGLEWSQLVDNFEKYLNDYSQGKAGISPGISNHKMNQVLVDEKGVKLNSDSDFIQIECFLNLPDSEYVDILFDRVEFPPNYVSRLYREQIGGKNIEGFRYCLRVDKNEIGLYDYGSNRILAKFIDNRGAENNYFNQADSTVRAFMPSVHFNQAIFEENNYKIVR